MMLKRMEIENIRSYEKEDIEFYPGVILFQGDIGSGKSSILLAMEFVLFGGTEQHFYDKIMRHGADKACVKLDFQIDEVDYTAYRSIRRTSSGIQPYESYLDVDDTRMELSWREMRDKIDSLLKLREGSGYKVETFHMGIYIPQEKMNEILSINDDQRLTSIRRIFNLEDYKRAVDNISIISRELRNEITQMRTRAEMLEETREELIRLREEKEEKEEELERSKTELDEIEEELDSLDEKLDEMSELKDELFSSRNKKDNLLSRSERFKKELTEMEDRLKDLEKQAERLDPLKDKAEEHEEVKRKVAEVKGVVKEKETLQRKLEALETRLEAERRELTDLKTRSDRKKQIQEFIQDNESLRKELKILREEKRDKEETRSEILGDIRSLKRERSSLKDEKKEILQLEDEAECPKCKQPISQEHVSFIVGEIDDDLARIDDKLAELTKQDGDIDDALSSIQDDIKELTQQEKELYSYEKELKKLDGLDEKVVELEEKIADRMQDIGSTKEKIASFEWDTSDLEKLESKEDELSEYRDEYLILVEKLKKREDLKKEIDEHSSRIKDTDEKISTVNERIEELEDKFSLSEYKDIKRSHQEAIARRSKLMERTENIKSSLKNIEERTEMIKERIEKMKEARDRSKHYQSIKSWIEGPFKESIKTIEEHRMVQINKQFESYFRGWFNEILDDPAKHAQLDDKFAPVISTSSDVTRVDDLSGGERTSVALAYRLAFNTMIKEQLGLESNLLVLDEPTMGFSREQLTRLKDVLEKTNADQIIIVSHENEIANLAEIEYIVSKEDGVSQVQRV